ncbi:MAG: ABC transporter permease [Verrucomicrobia bacterium]|nr:ABC transporter permease [Verrucomicrobiota bacterium]
MTAALRQLWRYPAFSALAILVLALGIGANATIFGFIDALMLQSLKVERPQDLVGVFDQNKLKEREYRGISYPNYQDLRAALKHPESLAAFNLSLLGLTEREQTKRVFAGLATSNFFQVMGAPLALGRGFEKADDVSATASPSLVLSYPLWQRMGGDAAVLGRTLIVNGQSFTVVGVTRAGFTGTSAIISPEFWVPIGLTDLLADLVSAETGRKLDDRASHRLMLQYRLAPGQTIESLNAELAVLSAQLEAAHPAENRDRRWVASKRSLLSVSTSPGTNESLAPVALLLFSMSGAVLLIASLNLANMLLARASSRRKEFAVRAALGAGRGILVRQLLTECVLLALLGGAFGLVVAMLANQALISALGHAVPFSIALEVRPNLSIFAATFGFCLLATVLAALGPALKASRTDVVHDLKENAADDRGSVLRGLRSVFAPRNALVIAQVALSLALLSAAGMFVRSAASAAKADPGFSVGTGALIEIDPGLVGYDEKGGREVLARLVSRLAGVPGVRSVSHASAVPFGVIRFDRALRVVGEGGPAKEAISAPFTVVGPNYFETVGLPVIRGRGFNSAEMEPSDANTSIILDEVLARRLFADREPLGQTVEMVRQTVDNDGEQGGGVRAQVGTGAEPRRTYTVVGIVPPLRFSLFDNGRGGASFVPAGATYMALSMLHVQTAPEAGSEAEVKLLQTLRREIAAVDPRLPVLSLKTLRSHYADNFEAWLLKLGARAFSVFGLAALFLAVVGLYGVKSYVVARRAREIGIRMALGAGRSSVLGLILREGLLLIALGVAVGLPLAIGVGQILSSTLYGVSAFDPLALGLLPLLLCAVAAVASYLPALRATRIDPARALRGD